MRIRTRKGLDIPIAGRPAPVIESGAAVRTVGLLGGDYPGLKPRLLVQPGDRVQAGQALFTDKHDPAVLYTSPGTGEVVEVNRGVRRSLQSILIALDDPAADPAATRPPEPLPPLAAPFDAATVRERLCSGGLWTALRTRPFGRVPPSDATPQAIFVTAIDTRPLAGDPALVVEEHGEAFYTGLRALTALTAGPVFVCTAPGWNGPKGDGERIRHAEFDGPHPAGLVGTHIHHLAPVGAGRVVWYVGYQDVMAIGKLLGDGVLWLERVVGAGGEGLHRPRLLRTRLGASLNELLRDELSDAPVPSRPHRVISGSVLDGRTASGAVAFLGRYHQQVCAIPSGGATRVFGWAGLRSNASFAGPLRRHRKASAALSLTTALNGRPTAMIAVDAFERLIPMDVLPAPLLRALLIGDTQRAQALGCLELEPEDLALCTFVCPGKNDYGAVLRVNLEQIDRDG